MTYASDDYRNGGRAGPEKGTGNRKKERTGNEGTLEKNVINFEKCKAALVTVFGMK